MAEEKRKRILSGIQPTGTPTLGNYIGAVRNWALLQSDYDCLYMVADLHSLTVRQNPAELRRRTRELSALLLAALDTVRGWRKLPVFASGMFCAWVCFYIVSIEQHLAWLLDEPRYALRIAAAAVLAPRVGLTGIAFACAFGWCVMLAFEVPYYFWTCKKQNLKKASPMGEAVREAD